MELKEDLKELAGSVGICLPKTERTVGTDRHLAHRSVQASAEEKKDETDPTETGGKTVSV